jgi:glycosyltransferase involved in cell wall biosynthesis
MKASRDSQGRAGMGLGPRPQIERPPTAARRVLHVVRQMNAGGIAIWLMNVLRHIDRQRYHIDFLVTIDAGGGFCDEIERLGSRVIPCSGYRAPWRFAHNFAKIMEDYGPYDVVHSHVYNYSGFVLRLAARYGVPVRIAHSHTDTRLKEASLAWPQRLWRAAYLGLTRSWISRYATLRLGASRLAGEALFGPDWAEDRRTRVIPLGLDFAPFGQLYDRHEVRQSLGLPADALVVGHVGNYVWHKNHPFLVEVLAELVRQEPRVWGLLIGHDLAGSAVEEQVRRLGVAERVLIAGPRNDVPRLMAGAMDVFLFPSHYEGLGLVLLEAQAAGLPCVLTDSLPEEVDLVPALMHRLPFSASAAIWAAAVLEAAQRPIGRSEAFASLLKSDFNLENSVQTLMRIYEQGS